MAQNRASLRLRSYRQVSWGGSLMCFPLCLGQLQSTHAFRRPWSLFRLLLSRLEERENSSSHHTYQHQTCRCRHPHHHHLTAISTLASSSCEAMKLSWLTFTMSDAVTTVTMRFSSRPTRFPTSSSSRSFASYCTTENNCCCCCCCCYTKPRLSDTEDEVRQTVDCCFRFVFPKQASAFINYADTYHS